MVNQRESSVAVNEYLVREAQAEYRSEYWNGDVVAMSGGSRCHNQIIRNLTFELGVQLRDGRCSPYFGETRLFTSECNCYFYPDAQVVCGEPQFMATETETVLNPTIIFEVLSPSTEAIDRGRKFACYRTLNSLQVYVLINQDQYSIEIHTSQQDGSWRSTYFLGTDNIISLEDFGLSLPLLSIYRGVPASMVRI